MRYDDDDEDFVDEYLLPDDDEDSGKMTERDKRVLAIVGLICAGIPTVSAVAKVSSLLGNLLLGGIVFACGFISYKDKSKKYPDKRYGSLTVMISGAVLIVRAVWAAIAQNAGFIPVKTLENIDMAGIAVFLLALGAAIMVIPFAADKKQRERCRYPVTAVCTDVRERHIKNGSIFIPVWEYTVGGRSFVTEHGSRRRPDDAELGDTIDLIVSHDDPTEVYRDASMSKLLGVFFGLVVAFGGFAILYHLIKVM